MVRKTAVTLLAGLLMVGLILGDDPKKPAEPAKEEIKGRIKKIDATAGIVTITITDQDGKSMDRDFPYDKNTQFLDATGAAKGAGKKDFREGVGVILTREVVTTRMQVGVFFGDEYKGKLKKIDGDKNAIVVTIDDKGMEKDLDFMLDKDTAVQDATGRLIREGIKNVKFVREGSPVLVQAEKKEGKTVTVKVQLLK